MDIFGDTLTTQQILLLMLALTLAFSFEFVNGFHDTANAVATVIYTNTLKPTVAIIWSGFWNWVGVLTSTGVVAFSIVALLPVELVIDAGSEASLVMVFSLLLSAIIWNFGTWYLGLPGSSSHTLIGSIMGVGLANSLLREHILGAGVNWETVKNVFFSLLVSPILGFSAAGLVLLLLKLLVKPPQLYEPPEQDKAPPLWIRALLILTCTGVSFAHGSNDGQKGMGLIVLILISILPGIYAVNLNADQEVIQHLLTSSQSVVTIIDHYVPQEISLDPQQATIELSDFLKTKDLLASDKTFAALATKDYEIIDRLSGKESFTSLSTQDRFSLRNDFYLVAGTINKLNLFNKFTDANEKEIIAEFQTELEQQIKFIPAWVKIGVAFALGIGTMIGWKRIVVTVGEKIGKEHLSYAQGASAEMVAMGTIIAADYLGLPVSTTHVLSSGVAGTMAANRSGLQVGTLKSILLAWVLTLPICVLLAAGIYAGTLSLLQLLSS
ncbi:MAG: inorganic phosphate transporter [Scytonema sp. PMC 1069.18]|nr:inorganic phosphate transporter [Scytonema sp. PMC 1069.18]MEC4885991.1 inorganic phosphate transporter [Scytonema sp. PMC 1070.18]